MSRRKVFWTPWQEIFRIPQRRENARKQSKLIVGRILIQKLIIWLARGHHMTKVSLASAWNQLLILQFCGVKYALLYSFGSPSQQMAPVKCGHNFLGNRVLDILEMHFCMHNVSISESSTCCIWHCVTVRWDVWTSSWVLQGEWEWRSGTATTGGTWCVWSGVQFLEKKVQNRTYLFGCRFFFLPVQSFWKLFWSLLTVVTSRIQRVKSTIIIYLCNHYLFHA